MAAHHEARCAAELLRAALREWPDGPLSEHWCAVYDAACALERWADEHEKLAAMLPPEPPMANHPRD